VTGTYACRLLGVPVGAAADAAALPLLFAIGAGKSALVLGGSGQGAPWDGPWAVAYAGTGPWTAADPNVPAHPSQVYEGLWALAGVAVIAAVERREARPPRASGSLFVLAVAWWLAGRALVGFTWRDGTAFGALGVEQALAALAFFGVAALLAVRGRGSGSPLVRAGPTPDQPGG
jgi:prolipoprotein diacylglyceryltransferase